VRIVGRNFISIRITGALSQEARSQMHVLMPLISLFLWFGVGWADARSRSWVDHA
jgi:hypothetical protein